MKRKYSLWPALMALLGLAAVLSAPAAPPNEVARMHPVDRVSIDGHRIVIGSPTAQVLNVLGKPARSMSGNPTGRLVERVWAYENMEGLGPDNKASNDGCHTLLVTFTDVGSGEGWKVSDMKLVNRSAEEFYAAQLGTRPGTGYIAGRIR